MVWVAGQLAHFFEERLEPLVGRYLALVHVCVFGEVAGIAFPCSEGDVGGYEAVLYVALRDEEVFFMFAASC